MRGLKQLEVTLIGINIASHLLQMRGLKPSPGNIAKKAFVASFTDAWIETCYMSVGNDYSFVASFTDAWIETSGRR